VIRYSNINVGLADYKITHTFYVVEKLNHFVLLVLDILQMTNCQIDLKNNCVSFNHGLTVLPLQSFDKSTVLLKSVQHIYLLPPHTQKR